jgi:hypothetical protein
VVVTAVQVKKYLQPLLDANDDVALVGRLLVVKPVTHILRGVLIDCRSSKETIVPVWFCYHMFGPFPDYSLNWGDKLWGRNWRTDDPNVSQALCAAIENVALPKIRPVTTIEAFHEALPVLSAHYGHRWEIIPDIKMFFDAAEGNIEAAKALCRDKICTHADPGPKEADVTIATAAAAKKLCSLLANDDIAGVVRTLHEWEETNVRTLKLAPYWQPAPFPAEEKLGLVR